MNGSGANGAVGDNVQTTYDSESSSRVVDLFIKVCFHVAKIKIGLGMMRWGITHYQDTE